MISPRIDPARLFQARVELEMTQEQVARKIGYSLTVVSLWERGLRNPKPDALRKLAKALEREPEWFYQDAA